MAEGRSIGTIFVDFDASFEPVTRAQQKLLKDATTTSGKIEDDFRKLGIKSSAEMDLMRAKITNSFNMIAHSSQATGNDILRAERAKNEQLAALNEQQFGKLASAGMSWVEFLKGRMGPAMKEALASGVPHADAHRVAIGKLAEEYKRYKETGVAAHVEVAGSSDSLLSRLKANWLAVSAAVVGAWMAVGKAMEFVELGAKAQQAEESFRLVASSSKIASDALIENLKRAAAGTVDDSEIMQRAVKGMILGLNEKQLVSIMENARIAARYAGTSVKQAFEDITNAIGTDMPRALRQYGLITREESRQVQEALAAGAKDIHLYDLAMAHAAVNSAKFGEAQQNAAEKVQVFHAAVNEAKEAVGKTTIGLASYVAAAGLWLDALDKRGRSIWAANLGHMRESKELADAAIEQTRKMNVLLGIKTPEDQAAEGAAREKARVTLADAEAALKKEQERVKRAAGAAKAMKEAEEEKAKAQKLAEQRAKDTEAFLEEERKSEDALQKARFEVELERQKIAAKAVTDTIEAVQKFREEEGAKEDALQRVRFEAELDRQEIAAKTATARIEAVEQFREEEGAKEDALQRVRFEAELDRQEMVRRADEASRQKFRDVFSSISDGITTAVRGVQQGTQTMEEAFRSMSINVMLSIQDFIIRQALGSLAKALAGMAFGVSRGGGFLGFLGKLLGFGGGGGELPFFQSGGPVRAPLGVPVPAIVHGGELVLTPEQQKVWGGPGEPQIVMNLQIYPGVPEAARREIYAALPMIRQEAVNAVMTSRNQGGAVARAFRHRS